MKRIFTCVMVLMSYLTYAASVSKTITVDGQQRSYIVYSPTEQSPNETLPVLMLLHPSGMSAAAFAEISMPQTVSDANHVLVVYPEALDEQSDELNTAFSLIESQGMNIPGLGVKYVWGAGARVSMSAISAMAGEAAMMIPFLMRESYAAGYVEANKSVDDVKYIDAVMDELMANYHANSTLYMAGASLGGAMTYKYANSATSRAKKIAVIHGFVGKGVEMKSSLGIPVCVFHSESDSTIKYKGGMFNDPIPATVKSIADGNGCTEKIEEELPDLMDDGKKVTLVTYSGGNAPKVYFYTVDNALHSDMLTADKNDIDYVAEMEKFFFLSDLLDVNDVTVQSLELYPNPATDVVYCSETGDYEVVDMMGRVVLAGTTNSESIDLSSLLEGQYVVVMKNDKVCKVGRLIKR